MNPQGRARGLIAVWKKAWRRKTWAPALRVPGHGRAITFILLEQMATQNKVGTLGPRQQW